MTGKVTIDLLGSVDALDPIVIEMISIAAVDLADHDHGVDPNDLYEKLKEALPDESTRRLLLEYHDATGDQRVAAIDWAVKIGPALQAAQKDGYTSHRQWLQNALARLGVDATVISANEPPDSAT